MKKLLLATAMVAGFGMALSANAGEIGGAVGGAIGSVGGAVGGIGGAVGGAVGKTSGAAGDIGGSVTGSAAATINGTASAGNIGNAGSVVSNVANFGVKADTKASAKAEVTAETRDEIRQINTLNRISSVSLVDVKTLANVDANASLSNALSQNASAAPEIQAALANNTNVMMAIMAENPDFEIRNVVATDMRANGELVIYTN